MADISIPAHLPADLPENWNEFQYVSPGGTDVGLTKQHGYNYLMEQVNATQEAVNQMIDLRGSCYIGNNVTPENSGQATLFDLVRSLYTQGVCSFYGGVMNFPELPFQDWGFLIRANVGEGDAWTLELVPTYHSDSVYTRQLNTGTSWVDKSWSVFTASSIQNTTLYVSTTGHDGTGDGSESSPYLTIGRALESIPKNLGSTMATIKVAGGTYGENVTISGFHNGILVITHADDSDTLIINGAVLVANCSARVECHYMTIIEPESLASDSIVTIEESYTASFYDCIIYGFGKGTSDGISAHRASSVILSRCNISRVRAAVSAFYRADVFIGETPITDTVTGCYANGGDIRIDPKLPTADVQFATVNGGRVYAGSQTSMPNY